MSALNTYIANSPRTIEQIRAAAERRAKEEIVLVTNNNLTVHSVSYPPCFSWRQGIPVNLVYSICYNRLIACEPKVYTLKEGDVIPESLFWSAYNKDVLTPFGRKSFVSAFKLFAFAPDREEKLEYSLSQTETLILTETLYKQVFERSHPHSRKSIKTYFTAQDFITLLILNQFGIDDISELKDRLSIECYIAYFYFEAGKQKEDKKSWVNTWWADWKSFEGSSMETLYDYRCSRFESSSLSLWVSYPEFIHDEYQNEELMETILEDQPKLLEKYQSRICK